MKKPSRLNGLPKGHLVALPKAFLDERGKLQPLVLQPLGSAVLITSRKGAVRANHRHRKDWHYAFVVSGKMEYFYRPALSKAKPKRLLVRAGQMVFTPPGEEHAMRFLAPTVFIALSKRRRGQAAYEEDLVRVRLI